MSKPGRAQPLGTPTHERYNPDGSVLGEPEVRVRCADCHASSWIGISDLSAALCPACYDAAEADERAERRARESRRAGRLELVRGERR